MSPPRIRDIASPIEAASRKAADRTGVDFGFLLKTARRESSLNPAAKAKSSSAAGLFQFIEQTWLGQLKRHGAKHGYGRYAEMIERGKDGRLHVKGEPGARRHGPALRSGLLGADGRRAGQRPGLPEGASAAAKTASSTPRTSGAQGAARLIEAHERNRRHRRPTCPRRPPPPKVDLLRNTGPAGGVYANMMDVARGRRPNPPSRAGAPNPKRQAC